jgi:hypothetical protein
MDCSLPLCSHSSLHFIEQMLFIDRTAPQIRAASEKQPYLASTIWPKPVVPLDERRNRWIGWFTFADEIDAHVFVDNLWRFDYSDVCEKGAWRQRDVNRDKQFPWKPISISYGYESRHGRQLIDARLQLIDSIKNVPNVGTLLDIPYLRCGYTTWNNTSSNSVSSSRTSTGMRQWIIN